MIIKLQLSLFQSHQFKFNLYQSLYFYAKQHRFLLKHSVHYNQNILKMLKVVYTYFPAAAAEHGCCAAAAASRRRELRLVTDVAESCAPFPLQLHHAHLQLHLLPFPLSLTDTDSTTVLDAHVFSPLHEFGASCPLPEIDNKSVNKNP